MTAKPRLLISEPGEFSARALDSLAGWADILDHCSAAGDFRSLLPLCEILWVRLGHRVDDEMLMQAPNLEIIVSPTTGLNHIDLEAAERRGVRVLSLRGETEFLRDVRATAEHTIALMLALMRHVPAAVRQVESGGWDRESLKGNELYGKMAGVVGYGRLGRIVARYLRAFDVAVLASDPALQVGASGLDVTACELTDLLDKSDIVTLHVNLTEQTRGFFGRRHFAAMKKGSWFINTSRGELVDEQALLDALESGWLAGAALDVLCDELPAPSKSNPLIRYSQTHGNLIITPHLGGCTRESMEKTENYLAGKLADVWNGVDGPVVPDLITQ